MKPSRLVIHHSASPRSTTTGTIRSWHLQRGFRDIGYHFVIEGDGKVVPGRHPHEMGAHAKGANRDSLGICVVGDNTRAGERWNAVQKKALRGLVASLRSVFGPMPVLRHCDVGTTATTCPGVDTLPI